RAAATRARTATGRAPLARRRGRAGVEADATRRARHLPRLVVSRRARVPLRRRPRLVRGDSRIALGESRWVPRAQLVKPGGPHMGRPAYFGRSVSRILLNLGEGDRAATNLVRRGEG